MPLPVDVKGGPAQLTWYIGQDDRLYAHELQTDCLFTFYEDVADLVPPPTASGGVPEAPTDGGAYARQDSGWAPIPPVPTAQLVITTIQPVNALENSSVTITVKGTGFTSNSVVNWGGYPLTTTFTNNTTLEATVTLGPGSSGVYTVVVTDGSALSNSVAFTVDPSARMFRTADVSCTLDINPDGDMIITQTAGPNAGKSVNLTYGKWI